jgi:hypothetical protein
MRRMAASEQDNLVCPHCIAPIGQFDRFCPRCGGSVTAHASNDQSLIYWRTMPRGCERGSTPSVMIGDNPPTMNPALCQGASGARTLPPAAAQRRSFPLLIFLLLPLIRSPRRFAASGPVRFSRLFEGHPGARASRAVIHPDVYGARRLIRWIAGRTTARTGLVKVGEPARTQCVPFGVEKQPSAGRREQAFLTPLPPPSAASPSAPGTACWT